MDMHFTLASLAGKGVHFMNLLDQPCPVPDMGFLITSKSS
jgi:hypothetical protein